MIHVEKQALTSPLVVYLEKLGKPYNIVESAAEVEDRKSELVVVKKYDNYCHPCPATKIYRCCNYYTTDVMEGCPFDCSYCILQAYLGHSNIQISGDIQSIEDSIMLLVKENVPRRLGTGELSDSLALDHLFPFTTLISPLINQQEVLQFEYKTKSANIKNLLNLNPKNIIVSWSLNPQSLVNKHEKGTAPLKDRIEAAAICAQAGYRIAFHFDPLIWYDNYKTEYTALLETLFNTLPETSVEYISLSTFRAPPALIDKMRERQPVPDLLQGDMAAGLDGKIRYFKPLRQEMLAHICSLFNRHWPRVFLYFCMEHASLWSRILNKEPGERDEFENLFPYRQKYP